jgi:hypothetical protein
MKTNLAPLLWDLTYFIRFDGYLLRIQIYCLEPNNITENTPHNQNNLFLYIVR